MIEIREVRFHCDHESCDETCWTDELSESNYEIIGWRVDKASPYIEEWRVYCPIHKINPAHSIGIA